MSIRSLAKKIIPAGPVHRLRQWRASVNKRFIKLFAGHRWLASFYYACFSRQFDREHQAVLQGRIAYWQSLEKFEASCALLRRNTHRLEKGLIMRPRRASFGAAYIQETVACYQRAATSGTVDGSELQWAYDVLARYFEVVEDTASIAKARQLFMTCAPTQHGGAGGTFTPYPHSELPAVSITTDQLRALYQRRRATRWYLSKPVPEAAVEEAARLAALAPSACNRQPFRLQFISDPARAAKVAGFAGGTVGFAEQLQALVVVIGDLHAYPTERDRHCIYIDASLAAMQFMLALETFELASCPINWPDIEFREKLMQRELGLATYERPVMLIAVGYPDPEGGVPYSQKKTVLQKENATNQD